MKVKSCHTERGKEVFESQNNFIAMLKVILNKPAEKLTWEGYTPLYTCELGFFYISLEHEVGSTTTSGNSYPKKTGWRCDRTD